MTKHFCDRCGADLGTVSAFVVGTVRRPVGMGIHGYDMTRDEKFKPTSGYELCESCANEVSTWLNRKLV